MREIFEAFHKEVCLRHEDDLAAHTVTNDPGRLGKDELKERGIFGGHGILEILDNFTGAFLREIGLTAQVLNIIKECYNYKKVKPLQARREGA